jgi:hypothetical protein
LAVTLEARLAQVVLVVSVFKLLVELVLGELAV